MKGVLVTGATMPLGVEIVRQILEADPQIRVLAVGIEPPDAIHRTLLDDRVRYRRVDLIRGRNVRGLMFGEVLEDGIEGVVHAARHRSAWKLGPRVRKLNVGTTRTLLRLSEQHPTVRRFVYPSSGSVYRIGLSTPNLLREDRELDLSPTAPQWVRDKVEADLAACAYFGNENLDVVVLRCAEILESGSGSQLYDYLGSRVCFRPLGFDPLVNLLTVADAAHAVVASLFSDATGVFNIPGADTLPLSKAIAKWGRVDAPVPGPLMGPLYRVRRRLRGTEFRWRLNRGRFHSGNILDGTRARNAFGYAPEHRVEWPFPDAGPPADL